MAFCTCYLPAPAPPTPAPPPATCHLPPATTCHHEHAVVHSVLRAYVCMEGEEKACLLAQHPLPSRASGVGDLYAPGGADVCLCLCLSARARARARTRAPYGRRDRRAARGGGAPDRRCSGRFPRARGARMFIDAKRLSGRHRGGWLACCCAREKKEERESCLLIRGCGPDDGSSR